MAESLQFSLGADTKNFTDGIGGAIGALAGLAAAFVSVQAITQAFSEAIDMGGRLYDLSTRTGETAGNLAILERAFDNASVGADKVGSAIGKMQKSMVDMQEGSKEAVDAFQQLGLTWDDLEGKSPTEQLELISIRLAAIQDPALRAETAMNIFGKSGAELLPVLINFSRETSIAKEQLGSLPDQLDRSAAAVDGLGDNLDAIGNKLTEVAYGFLSEVAPALEVFTSKLAGVDAASIGAGLAQAMAGAFVAPMKAAEILGETLMLGVKLMGNELVFQFQYWSDLMFRTFGALSDQIIPMIGSNMSAIFEIAVATLGLALSGAAESFWLALKPALETIGLGDMVDNALEKINTMEEEANQMMVDATTKIADNATVFQTALDDAKNSSTVVRQDFFGAEDSSQKIKQDFADLQGLGKAAIDELNRPFGPMAPQTGAEITDEDRRQIQMRFEADMKVQQEANKPTTTTTKTASQLAAEQQKQLGLIAASNLNQASGQSASARRVQDLQKELDTMVAMGEVGTPQWAAAQKSLSANLDIAFGNVLTSADKDTAHTMAFDQWSKDTSQSMLDLEREAQADILEQKRANDPLAVQEQRKKAQEVAAGKAPSEKPITLQSMVNTVVQILQKIEPKIPQHIMS